MRMSGIPTLCLGVLMLAVPARVQLRAQVTGRVRVVSAADRAPIIGAELRDSVGQVIARSDAEGLVRWPVGREVRSVRALGFRMFMLRGAERDSVLALEPLPTVLPVFTTTVGQRVIRAAESPRTVTVLDRRDIDAAAAVSANQLLRQIPGLQEIASPPARTSISIRGFSDARVLVLVDGEPIPEVLPAPTGTT